MQLQKFVLGVVSTSIAAVALTAHCASAQNFTFVSHYTNNTIVSGTSTLTFSDGASQGIIGVPTAIDLSGLKEFTTVGTGPNTFNADPYTVIFTLSDVSSGTFKTLDFTGNISGVADGGVNNNAPSAFFTDTYTGATFLDFVFPAGTYRVSRTGFVSPGPSGKEDGAQGAAVIFTPNRGGGGIPATPEPGTVVSMVVGMGMLAAFAAIQRRKSSMGNHQDSKF